MNEGVRRHDVMLARVWAGNARAHLRYDRESRVTEEQSSRNWARHRMIAASSMVLSASLWSLVSPAKALRGYAQAADLYRKLGHDYWRVLALLSGGEHQHGELSIEEVNRVSPVTVAFGMLAEARLRALEDYRVSRDGWKHFGNVPVGRLGVPLDYYAACALAMMRQGEIGDLQVVRGAVVAYLRRAAEVFKAASHDAHHWQQRLGSILPAEPEAVAVTVSISRHLRESHGVSLMRILSNEVLDEHEHLLVEVGDRLSAEGSAGVSR